MAGATISNVTEPGPHVIRAQQSLTLTRVELERRWRTTDSVAREEALQLMVDGAPLGIVMRTPGDDIDLALGLLHAEGVLGSLADVAFVTFAATGQMDGALRGIDLRPDPRLENLVDVHMRQPLSREALGWQRNLPSSSACGICGSATLDAVLRFQLPVVGEGLWTRDRIVGLPDRLRSSQAVFSRTGGLHAAGLLPFGKTSMDVAEDVGRHNAVDKLVGRALLEGRLPLTDSCLVVSGRAGFEIVQKAAAAQVAVVAAVSAPSSLAVQTADALGVTLIGFLRGQSFNIYTHPERISTLAAADIRDGTGSSP